MLGWVERKKREAEGEGEKESLSTFPAEHRARHGSQSHDPEVMTWAEIKSQSLNRLSHPGVPGISSFNFADDLNNLLKVAQLVGDRMGTKESASRIWTLSSWGTCSWSTLVRFCAVIWAGLWPDLPLFLSIFWTQLSSLHTEQFSVYLSIWISHGQFLSLMTMPFKRSPVDFTTKWLCPGGGSVSWEWKGPVDLGSKNLNGLLCFTFFSFKFWSQVLVPVLSLGLPCFPLKLGIFCTFPSRVHWCHFLNPVSAMG